MVTDVAGIIGAALLLAGGTCTLEGPREGRGCLVILVDDADADGGAALVDLALSSSLSSPFLLARGPLTKECIILVN